MKIRFNSLLIIMGLMVAMFSATLSAQNNVRVSQTTVESVVVDENGKPVAGALIRGNEGSVFTKTDNSGKFTITVPAQSSLLIESLGYEPAFFNPFQYADQAQLQLVTSPLMDGNRDSVQIAFGKTTQKRLVNAVGVINPDEIREYDNINSLSQALLRITGMYNGGNIRSIGSPLYVVDGLPRGIDNISLAEIESISVLKDINASVLYGSQARNGVVLITTKRGEAYKKDLKVTAYYGMNTPLSKPEYLSSAEFMDLYNQAWANDGNASPYYNDIENYRTGNPNRYPSLDYYSPDYVKDTKPFSKTMLELSGGNEKARYYVNTGWERIGSYLNFGEGKKSNQNKFNVRGNVDMTLSSWITTSLDASAFFDNARLTRGANFWTDAATRYPHVISPLIPIELINPDDPLLLARKNDVDGRYIFGGNETYQTNAIADIYAAGHVERSQRTFTFNNRANFDLNRVLEGLSFHTNISFDYYTIYDQAIQNTYSVYEIDEMDWTPQDEITRLSIQHGKDEKPGIFYAGNSSYNRRLGFYGTFDYNRTFNEVHEVKASLLGYSTMYEGNTIGGDVLSINYQGIRNHTAGLRMSYAYLQKYMVDFSAAYVHSNKLAAGNRGAYSPSMGLAWLISREDFMQSASSVDYLKLRLSAGILNSDENIDGFFLHTSRYGGGSALYWYDGAYGRTGTLSQQGANPKLGFEKYKDVNIGLDGQFFNNRLWVNANAFWKSNYDILARPQTIYPEFYSAFIPWENFGENSYKGFELGLTYKERIGNIKFEMGGNMLHSVSKIEKRDEIFEESYRYRAGTSLEGRWGLVADGFFMDQSEIDNHPRQSWSVVKPGDIKYVDQNNDGVIDVKDQVLIGRNRAPWTYGLHLKVSYANITLFMQGNGYHGADGMISGDYYWIDGNKKYSEYARDRWTEETKLTATMPRLSAGTNTNNHQASTFWLYKDNFFTLNRTQLTYALPFSLVDNLMMMSIDLFVDGSNLFTISKHRKMKELNIGGEPYSRNFSLGVKATF